MVSLNKALLGPYFLGGGWPWGTLGSHEPSHDYGRKSRVLEGEDLDFEIGLEQFLSIILFGEVLLMLQKSGDHHLGCIKPCK